MHICSAHCSSFCVIFLQLILFANTAAFFYSLLGLVSHCFWEGDSGEEVSTRWRCVNDQSLTRFLACFKKPTSRLFTSI